MKSSLGYFLIPVILFSLAACNRPDSAGKNADIDFWDGDNSPIAIGEQIIDELLGRPDLMMMTHTAERCTLMHYAEACAGFGAVRLAGLMGDSAAIDGLTQRYLRVIVEDIDKMGTHVDENVLGILPLELYLQTGNELFLDQGLQLADVQWEDQLPNGLTNQTRYWIDDIWMIGSLQVQAYRATGKVLYLERAALEIEAYLQELQQPNGLFHHGQGTPFFWGRGNGWVAAGLAEVLSELPESNPHYTSLLEGYRKMMQALLAYQAEDGMWRQLIDHPEAWKETSSSAMFGYAMSVGVREGLLTDPAYARAYEKAWLALVEYLNDTGQMTGVCVGTGKGDNAQYYLDRPQSIGDFHGQAPMLWFAYSLLAETGRD